MPDSSDFRSENLLKTKKSLLFSLLLVENIDFPTDTPSFCDIERVKIWNVSNKIKNVQMSRKAIVFHAFSRAVGEEKNENVLKTVWKRIENDDFGDFAGQITPGQPAGAPDRFLRLRGGKKHKKKTVQGKENNKKL